MFIQPTEGTVICYEGKQLLFHSTTDTLLQFEDMETGEVFKWNYEKFKREASSGVISKVKTVGSAVSVAIAEPLPLNYPALLIGLTEFESKEQARFAHVFMAFQRSNLDIKNDAHLVAEVMEAACKESGFEPISMRQLRVTLKKYRRYGDVLYACTPQRRGRRAQTYGLEKRDESLIEQAIEEHYLQLEQPSIASAYRHYLRIREDDQVAHGEIAGLPPSLRTFERRVGRLESFQKTVRRHGAHEAKRLHRLVRGVYSDVAPMEVGEMDDCYLPVLAVSDDFSHALGVPKLCSIRDRGTGCVTAFFVWCGEVSTFTALATFRNLLSDKAPLLRRAGLSEEAWPYTGPFNTLVIDRGPNLDAQAVVRSAAAMGSAVQLCPTKKAWAKPFVERLHGYVLEYIAQEFPGRVFDDVVSFRSYKAKAKAIIPLSALIRILTKFFVDVVNGVPREGHRTTPTEEMVAWLRDHPPAIPVDLASIDLLTSLPIKRRVNQEGIRWENLQFVSDELAALVRRIGHGVEVTVYINPADLGKVNVADPRTGKLIAAYCTWSGYACGLTLPEHQLLCRTLKARREKIRLAALIGLQRFIRDELANAREGKKLLGIALKAERMQQSSQTYADAAPSANQAIELNGGPVDGPPPSLRNQSVLDAILF